MKLAYLLLFAVAMLVVAKGQLTFSKTWKAGGKRTVDQPADVSGGHRETICALMHSIPLRTLVTVSVMSIGRVLN